MYSHLTEEEAEKRLNGILTFSLKNGAVEKIRRLPSEDTIKHIEMRVRAIHAQAYWNLVLNFNLTAIHNSVIMLELFLKDLWFSKIGVDSDRTLTPLIDLCYKEGILSKEEKNFCKKVDDKCRNWYLHGNYEKLSAGATVEGIALKVDTDNPKKTIEAMQEATSKPLGAQSPRTFTTKDLPVLKQIATLQRADKEAEAIFLDIDDFIRKKSDSVYSKTEMAT